MNAKQLKKLLTKLREVQSYRFAYRVEFTDMHDCYRSRRFSTFADAFEFIDGMHTAYKRKSPRINYNNYSATSDAKWAYRANWKYEIIECDREEYYSTFRHANLA